MQKNVLITGGAGFIGSHLSEELVLRGYSVRVLDNLCPEVHGRDAVRPEHLHPDVEFIVGDLRDPAMTRYALDGVDAVIHMAAATGARQSMFEVERFTDVNNVGTAVLLQALTERPIAKLLVASSMSVYGEGLYSNGENVLQSGIARTTAQLERGSWDPIDEEGTFLQPLPTPESKVPELRSIYALSKFDQERMCLLVGRMHRIPTVALRIFNVYGPYELLTSSNAGVIAQFAGRLLRNLRPRIFEDGEQRRDFIHVTDVARALCLALESPMADNEIFNIGSGQSYTIHEVALRLAAALNRDYLDPELTGLYRVGDVRHCFSDSRKAQLLLNFHPQIDLEEGLTEYAHWLQEQVIEAVVPEAKPLQWAMTH